MSATVFGREVPEWLRDLFDRADLDLARGTYRAVSVDPARFRRQLRTAGRPYIEPGGHAPDLVELDATARWVVEQSRFKTSALSGFAGLGGFASVPPEVAAQSIAVLRMAQRLCLVYGFDPATDRGRTAFWRALSAGLDVELPSDGLVEMRASELPEILRPALMPRSVGGALAQALVVGSARYVAGRLSRFVPLLSSGVAAAEASRRTPRIGERMIEVLRRLSEPGALPSVQEALEVSNSVSRGSSEGHL